MLYNRGAGEDSYESLGLQGDKPVNPKGNHSLKLQHFGHLMRRVNSLEKTLMLGKTEEEEKGVTEDEIFGWNH